ncbi:arsenic resistance protein [Sharpea azabuensis]|uniref:arsenic resistance protein n=1 Tax=Sharpea azabuensis TaxID=322505 RepID=UPI001568D0FB|nr:arsenical-resistance protein [Sharpea azabuensis]
MVKNKDISIFQRYLSIWVILCMIAGVMIGHFFPAVVQVLNKMQIAGISIPIAILIWIMIYPMMIKVDFQSIRQIKDNPKGLFLTWIVNWLIKPFTMYLLAYFFLFYVFKSLIPQNLARQYLAGAVLLGAAPCTAMVFVWSTLTHGRAAYTIVQVATNDCIILFAFVPIVKFLLGVSKVSVPYSTLFVSIFLFVVIPLAGGILTRVIMMKKLLTLVLIFTSQSAVIINNPIHIVLIAIPLILQTFLIFFIAYLSAKAIHLPFDIAAPAGMIGASNFFELAVAVAIALFGTTSPAALATTVGVLTEVPVMLTLVNIANKTQNWFIKED